MGRKKIVDFRTYLTARIVVDINGCWIWQKHRTRRGYGKTLNRSAHRISYEVFVGPIPEGLMICHRCNVRPCINPDHLYAGTAHDNMQDALRAKESRIGKLTAESVTQIRSLYSLGIKMSVIARQYGVSHDAISNIIKRRSWIHV